LSNAPQFSTYIGKAFLEKIKPSVTGWSNMTDKMEAEYKIIVDAPENIQMLYYYLSYPPAEFPLLGALYDLNKFNSFEYTFTNNSNFYQVVNLLLTSHYKEDLEPIFSKFFEPKTKIKLPEGASVKLNKRFDEMSSISNILSPHVQTIKACCLCMGT